MPKLEFIARQQYLNLETFRKSGVPVRTPVWFTQDGSAIFVITAADAGKVKRIRHNSQVNIAPCKMDGTPLGGWVPAVARIVSDDATIHQVNQMQDQKYGLFGRILSLPQKLRGTKTTVLEIRAA